MLQSLFLAVSLNELQTDAEGKGKQQSGGTKARMTRQGPAGAWST